MGWTVDSTSVTTDSTSATTDGSGGFAGLAGAATDAITAAARAINFASVRLTSPLYTGIGGILDPNLVWPFSSPIVGSVISFDPSILTVEPDGSTVWTTNNGAAEIQFNDGTNLNEVDLFVTPLMVGYANDLSSAQGSLIAAAQLAGAATTLSSAAGSLTTGITLAGAASDLTTATAALITAIQLAAGATDVTSGSGTLSGVASFFTGAATDTTLASAALSTQIKMAGAAADVVSAAGALTTLIVMTAAAQDATAASGALSTGIKLAGAASDTISGSALLGSLQPLLGAANDVTSAAGALFSQIFIFGAATDATSAAGSLSTAIKLSGIATDASSAAGALGVLALNLRPSHLITIGYYSNQLLGQAGPLPYGEFFSRVGDQEIYAIDWTGWLSSFWERGAVNAPGTGVRPTAPNGFQFITALGGQSGNYEPLWPTVIGQTVNDGSTVWTCEALDLTTLFATVQTAQWSAPSGIAVRGQEISGQLTLAEIDASGAVSGTNYPINVAATMSDGEVKVGQILLKVS